MTASALPIAELDRLQQLTRRYARYSRSVGGLSSVLGGALSLMVFTLALWLELTPAARVLFAALPLLWLVGKELLRRYYYQRAGAVQESISTYERWLHYFLTGFVAFVSISILSSGLTKFGLAGLLALPWPKLGYFIFVLALPFVTWRWLWSSTDFIVGTCLFCQAAVIVAGRSYQLDPLGYFIIATGLAGIALGIKEHYDYLQLRRELQQLRQ
jgi:hypothetical protein